MSTPIERLSTLTIGTVEFVSPSEIKVILETDAPQATALNTGYPNRFPRINGYLLIPNESGAVVGLIVWLGVERSPFPKRTGLKDFGLIDLPFPLRKLALTPVGTLMSVEDRGSGGTQLKLVRGVSVFPSVGDSVLLPTDEQVRAIIEAHGENRRVKIGTSPLASNAKVTVDPNKMFGRHLAVLGNTGSGKSCTVAGLIRWSLDSAEKEKLRIKGDKTANARFIILDPNGEYSVAFKDLKENVRLFKVSEALESGEHPLTTPAWMWDLHEWSAFASASPGAQRPILQQGLRGMRAGVPATEAIAVKMNRLFRSYKIYFEQMTATGISAYQGFPGNKNTGMRLRKLCEDIRSYSEKTEGAIKDRLDELCDYTESIVIVTVSGTREYFNDFSETQLNTVIEKLNSVVNSISLPAHIGLANEDAPIRFSVDDLPEYLESLASFEGGQTAQFISSLNIRIRSMLSDPRLKPIVNPEKQLSFEEWLTNLIGADGASNGQIAILDLSLVPSDVLHIIISVIARIVFESCQRYRKLYQKELPTVLVLEEAHSFVQRGSADNEIHSAGQMCRETFERIAREGRKFGLGLVLSSQRPVELSQTVLAQCNTFLLHRIVNDRDQDYVSRLVPDYLGALLKELPSLPTRKAILFGWATQIPVLVEIKELPEEYRPRSSDPEFWEIWTGEKERSINWREIVNDWTGNTADGENKDKPKE